jgi:hypothetical protein
LLKDPNIAKPKIDKSQSMYLTHPRDVQHRPSPFQSTESAQTLPSLSVERIDNLRSQIGLLKAERRAEREQLKKLEHSLSDSQLQEHRAHLRTVTQREKRAAHQAHLKSVEHQMKEIRNEAKERSAKLGHTWPGAARASPNSTVASGARAGASGAAEKAVRMEERASTPPVSRELQIDEPADAALQPASKEGPNDGEQIMPTSTSAPSVDADEAVNDKLEARKSAVLRLPPGSVDIDSIKSAADLRAYRKEVIRREIMSRAERRADPAKEFLDGREVTFFEMKLALINLRLNTAELQKYWDHLETCQASDIIGAFALINLNGSGRICSQEFADGVSRIGVQWQKLTGFKRPKDLFHLFDDDRDGVITLYELFPPRYHPPKENKGSTTPEFWQTWVKSNPTDAFHLDDKKSSRQASWHSGKADDSLAVMREKDRKDAEAAYQKKWLRSTMRRMKGRGKSDARVREMCCLHLPKGTGPADRQGVATFSEQEVKQCKREYSDAVMEPQRTVLKDLFELREIRKDLSTSRHKLFNMIEPKMREQLFQEQKASFAMSLGGLGLHKESLDDEEAHEQPYVDSALSAALG